MSAFGFEPVAVIAGQLHLADAGEAPDAAKLRSKSQARSINESAWQGQVVPLARLYGWRVYHTYDSRRSEWGWPDLVLVRPPELVIAELKTDRGRLSRAQEDWLNELGACGVEVAVWRPRDFDQIHERLKRRREGT